MPQIMQILIEQYIAEIKKIYGAHLRKVILYGSYARFDLKSARILLAAEEYRGAKVVKLKKLVMRVIMMISILPAGKKLRDRLLWQMNLYSWLKSTV